MHFESFLDEPEPEDDNSDDDDDDTDQDDFGAGDGGNDFDWNLEQDFDGGGSFGESGRGLLTTNFTTVSKSVIRHQEGILEQVQLPENLERTCNPIES